MINNSGIKNSKYLENTIQTFKGFLEQTCTTGTYKSGQFGNKITVHLVGYQVMVSRHSTANLCMCSA